MLKKRIYITIMDTRMVRFFLDTEVLDKLATLNNIEIVILHNHHNIDFFLKSNNILSKKIPKYGSFSILNKFFQKTYNYIGIFKRFKDTGTGGLQNTFLNKTILKKLYILILILLSNFIFRIPFLGKFLYNSCYLDDNILNFLKNDDIYGLILSSPVLIEDRIISQCAKKLKIPVIIGNDGWDTFVNFSHNDSYIGALVWGEMMYRDAQNQGFKNIIPIGIPYKKKLITNVNLQNINRIKQKYGFLENDFIILFIGSSFCYTGEQENKLVDIIMNEIENKKLINTKVLFRAYPGSCKKEEMIEYYKKYKNNKNFVVLYPSSDTIDSEPNIFNRSPIEEFAELYSICNVLINILSMSILEAGIANKPSIILNCEDLEYPTRYVTKGHIYKKLISNGVIELTNSNQLVNVIKNIHLNKNYNQFIKYFDYEMDNYEYKIVELFDNYYKE